jgi:regulator of protease activity HflC (stomatin/prohibitin superfamily)
MTNVLPILGEGAVAIASVAALSGTFFTVDQGTAAVVQRFGRFVRVAKPGLRLKLPFIDRVVGRINLRVQQLDVAVESKTQDNAFVHVVMALAYNVLPDKVYEAVYKLDDPTRQIRSFVFDVVRTRVAQIKLDELYDRKSEVADMVKRELTPVMEGSGYGLLSALITHIEPDATVKDSMNKLHTAQGMRAVAAEEGEARRILKVKTAEGAAQSAVLRGRGLADKRKAIVAGLRESVDEFRKTVPDAATRDVMNFVLMTQYFDMLRTTGPSSWNHGVIIPPAPDSVDRLTEHVQNAMMVADQAVKEPDGWGGPLPDSKPAPQASESQPKSNHHTTGDSTGGQGHEDHRE